MSRMKTIESDETLPASSVKVFVRDAMPAKNG